MGLKRGVIISIELQLVAVEVELDATALIFLVFSNFDLFGDVSALVDNCRNLLVQIPQTRLLHCFIGVNFCADALAKLGVSLDSYSHFVSPPVVFTFCILIIWVCIVIDVVIQWLRPLLFSIFYMSSFLPKEKRVFGQ